MKNYKQIIVLSTLICYGFQVFNIGVSALFYTSYASQILTEK
ncbi:Uncharacterized protein dnl_59720 [Desulfonema limicola]|uniref:Uncharacterized protein n=1 Tax=Desulfonema limicola TaxID=45656 RepID=A0A975BE99_9BACT|nr:Uncharacterized protein dnl_59720 [Desulfonema limicola]